jgi:hypothetical protein
MQETIMQAGGKFASLSYSSILKMEVTRSSEKLADFQGTTWRYIPENKNSS